MYNIYLPFENDSVGLRMIGFDNQLLLLIHIGLC